MIKKSLFCLAKLFRTFATHGKTFSVESRPNEALSPLKTAKLFRKNGQTYSESAAGSLHHPIETLAHERDGVRLYVGEKM